MVTIDQLLILSVFCERKKKINVSNFRKRLIFQKEVYLLQQLGIPFGYPFSWYKRGPYSSSITFDGYSLESIQDEVTPVKKLSPEEKILVKKFNQLVEEANQKIKGYSDKGEILELLASLHFIIHEGYPKPESLDHAIALLLRKKPRFSEDSAKIAHELLRKYDLTT